MKAFIIKLKEHEVVEQLHRTAPRYITDGEYAKLVILAILSEHNLLRLCGNAETTYYGAKYSERMHAKDVAENLVIDGEIDYWDTFRVMFSRGTGVYDVVRKRKNTFKLVIAA